MANFQGLQTANVIHSRFVQDIIVANEGFPFTNAVDTLESIKLGLRKPGQILISPATGEPDVGGRPFTEGYNVNIRVPVLQTTMPMLQNAYLLGGVNSQVLIKDAAGKFYNFVENTNATTPDGSTLLGLTYKLTITPRERVLDLDFNGYLFKNELDWLLANMASAQTGGSGGTEIELTAIGMTKANRRKANMLDITHGGVSIGKVKDFTLEIQSMGPTDNRNRTRSNEVEVKLEVIMQQTATGDMQGAVDQAELDATQIITTEGGESFKFTSGAIGHTAEIDLNETERLIKLTYGGKIPYNIDDATPNAIDFGITSATVAEFDLVGYA